MMKKKLNNMKKTGKKLLLAALMLAAAGVAQAQTGIPERSRDVDPYDSLDREKIKVP